MYLPVLLIMLGVAGTAAASNQALPPGLCDGKGPDVQVVELGDFVAISNGYLCIALQRRHVSIPVLRAGKGRAVGVPIKKDD